MSERDSILEYLQEIEAKANRVTGPTPLPGTTEAFVLMAGSDVPALCRAVRAAIEPIECYSCGVGITVLDRVMKALLPLKESP